MCSAQIILNYWLYSSACTCTCIQVQRRTQMRNKYIYGVTVLHSVTFLPQDIIFKAAFAPITLMPWKPIIIKQEFLSWQDLKVYSESYRKPQKDFVLCWSNSNTSLHMENSRWFLDRILFKIWFLLLCLSYCIWLVLTFLDVTFPHLQLCCPASQVPLFLIQQKTEYFKVN